MVKPTIKYIGFNNGYCGLSVESVQAIIREHGTANVREIRHATEEDISHVRAMRGYVPDGRIVKIKE